MAGNLQGYDFEGATNYHYGQFPPVDINYAQLIGPLSSARDALARYDTKLERLHNKELMLAPLRNAEAVVSSRMEGTIATLDEILRIQADDGDEEGDGNELIYRQEALEVYSYARAIKTAQSLMEGDQPLPICSRLIKQAHSRLLLIGGGGDKTPGEYKREQNYVVDRRKRKILFIPISEQGLEGGIATFERYINDENVEPIIQTAVSHAEFEALHPFKDGNGRIGRMLVPLNLWQRRAIHAPHFYVSPAIEERREEYIDRLRAVSEQNAWTEWVAFFLEIVERQAEMNMEITDRITALYEEMKERFQNELRSRWATAALDYVFARPVFRNATFRFAAGIPPQTAHRMNKQLIDAGLLTVVEPASGRRAALLAFTQLLEVVRT